MPKAPFRLTPQSIWDEEAVLEEFKTMGLSPIHHDKFMRALFDQFQSGKITQLEEYKNQDSNMSPKLEALCRSGKFVLATTKVVRREDSKDGSTSKFLFQLQDGAIIETVLMRYSNTMTQDHTRTTICVSSQVGCAQACSFCATGMLGLTRSLTQGEILEQFVWCCAKVEQVRNVVFMGQGEPLANFDAVVTTVRILTSQARFSLREQRVTVSTVGIVDKLAKLIEVFPNITIALSLHAPTQQKRQLIVPSARKHSLTQLVDLIDVYHQVTKKKMLIEYVMLDGINCDEESAHLLGKLLQGRGVLLNLIPFNPTLTRAKHIAPTNETIATFAQIITENYGLLTTTRKEFGQDINAACGQLAISAKKMKKRKEELEKLKETGELFAVCEQEQHQAGMAANEVRDLPKDERGYMIIDEDGDEDPEDYVDDGMEGIASALGWLGQDDDKKKPHTTQGDEAITIKRDDLIDPTKISCSSSSKDDTSPQSGTDIEDMLKPAAAPQANNNDNNVDDKKMKRFVQDINDKDYQEICPLDNIVLQDLCDYNCHCHRTLRHRLVTKDIAENDIYNYSLAVLNIGPRLIEEQNQMNKRKGETNKARMNRVGGGSLQGSASFNGSLNEFDGDACVGVDNSDNMSMHSMMGGMSMNSRMSQAVSTLKIAPREKDLVARVFLPNQKLKNKLEKIEISEKTWDAERIVDEAELKEKAAERLQQEKELKEKQQKDKEYQNKLLLEQRKKEEQQRQQTMMLAIIAIIAAVLLSRRFL